MIEEELKKYFQGHWPGTETAEQCNTDLHFTPPAIVRLAEHFYELGRKQPHSQRKVVPEGGWWKDLWK